MSDKWDEMELMDERDKLAQELDQINQEREALEIAHIRQQRAIEVYQYGLKGHLCGKENCDHDECKWARKHLNKAERILKGEE